MTPLEFQSQFLPIANKSVETTLAASQIIFSMAEELQAVYFAASRQALSDALQGAQSVLSMQSPQDFAAAQSQLTQVSVSKLMATPQNILEISMRAASELGGLLNAQVSELNSAASDLVAFYPPDCPSLPLSLTTVTRVAAQPEAADHLLPF